MSVGSAVAASAFSWCRAGFIILFALLWMDSRRSHCCSVRLVDHAWQAYSSTDLIEATYMLKRASGDNVQCDADSAADREHFEGNMPMFSRVDWSGSNAHEIHTKNTKAAAS